MAVRGMVYTTQLKPGVKPLQLTGWACDPNLVTGASTVIVEWTTSGGSTWTQTQILADQPTATPVACLGNHGFLRDLSFIPMLTGAFDLRVKTSDILATRKQSSLTTLPFIDITTKVATLVYTVTVST